MDTMINLPQQPADLRARLDALRKDIAVYIDSIDSFPEDGDVIVQVNTNHKYPPNFVLANTRRVVELEWGYEFRTDLHPVNAKGELTKGTDHPAFTTTFLSIATQVNQSCFTRMEAASITAFSGSMWTTISEIKLKAKK
jgi:hypothetical protein